MAASAAYAIASGASRIVTTPSGIAGSIGVYAARRLQPDARPGRDHADADCEPNDGSKVAGNPV
jgi:ClpP class serine protease